MYCFGKFGEVKRCRERETGLEFAIKLVPINSAEDKQIVMNEIRIMNRLYHPRLIQLHDAFQTPQQIAMVVEL
ncbi:unnamed protein product [Protopolystoma xenopodis]|uniref:Protein kinase domain-containing protein n=1 Tax=Protopolystoma xenopodis TaxID=117903 RepID=A0A448WJ60_9PLAT|nr:unnamed protein product [Protopolystoma xenopodis]